MPLPLPRRRRRVRVALAAAVVVLGVVIVAVAMVLVAPRQTAATKAAAASGVGGGGGDEGLDDDELVDEALVGAFAGESDRERRLDGFSELEMTPHGNSSSDAAAAATTTTSTSTTSTTPTEHGEDNMAAQLEAKLDSGASSTPAQPRTPPNPDSTDDTVKTLVERSVGVRKSSRAPTTAVDNPPLLVHALDESSKMAPPGMHSGGGGGRTPILDVVSMAVSLVVGVVALPLALCFRFSARFRNALTALNQPSGSSSSAAAAAAASKRKRSLVDSDAATNLAARAAAAAAAAYAPALVNVPPNFRSVLSPLDVDRLVQHLPPRLAAKDWRLLFATELHGFDLHAAYRRLAGAGPCLVAVMDTNRNVLVGFCSESVDHPGNARKHIGTGESWVALVHPDFHVHTWQDGFPQEFVLASDEFFAFGGGSGFALWLDSTFERGTSEACGTFGTTRALGTNESFKCVAAEFWGFSQPSLRSSLGRNALQTMSGVLGRLTRKPSVAAALDGSTLV